MLHVYDLVVYALLLYTWHCRFIIHACTLALCSRRSRARRTRQSRQATQPVPSDVLERIKKHDEEMSKSEDSSGSSSTNSTPPQKRKEEEKAPPTMSVFRPAARPTPKNKVLNPPSAHQTLWTSSRKKESGSTPSASTAAATSTVTEPTPKEKGSVDFIASTDSPCLLVALIL